MIYTECVLEREADSVFLCFALDAHTTQPKTRQYWARDERDEFGEKLPESVYRTFSLAHFRFSKIHTGTRHRENRQPGGSSVWSSPRVEFYHILCMGRTKDQRSKGLPHLLTALCTYAFMLFPFGGVSNKTGLAVKCSEKKTIERKRSLGRSGAENPIKQAMAEKRGGRHLMGFPQTHVFFSPHLPFYLGTAAGKRSFYPTSLFWGKTQAVARPSSVLRL